MFLHNVKRFGRFCTGLAVPAATLTLSVSAMAPAVADVPTGLTASMSSSISSAPLAPAGFAQAFADLATLPTVAAPIATPAAASSRVIGEGKASFYGSAFAGRPTASGERFDPTGLTAAHRSLPFGSKVRVTNQSTGQSVIVRINDRGPFHGNRVIDLSHEAAKRIGLVQRGSGHVELALLAG